RVEVRFWRVDVGKEDEDNDEEAAKDEEAVKDEEDTKDDSDVGDKEDKGPNENDGEDSVSRAVRVDEGLVSVDKDDVDVYHVGTR
ncbi:MAG: hypothetical protein Q9216_006983, partial [Gyalolechia sp. 2 TL-2023]